LSDVDVRFYWDLAVGLTAVDTGEELLKMVVDLFTIVCSHERLYGDVQTIQQKGNSKSYSFEKKTEHSQCTINHNNK